MIITGHRKDIPPFQCIKKFDIEKLLKCINVLDLLNRNRWEYLNFNDDHDNKFANITKTHSNYYENWFQFKNGGYQDLFLNEIDYDLIENKSSENFLSIKSRVKVLKDKDLLKLQNNAEFIFKPVLKDLYKNSYIEEIYNQISNMFPGGAGRAKIAFMAANSVIASHIDADSSLILKVHIPLVTDQKVKFVSRYKGENIIFHMPNDGSAILLNVGIPHSVMNPTSIDRYHLVINIYNF